jgi:hypothetical protein
MALDPTTRARGAPPGDRCRRLGAVALRRPAAGGGRVERARGCPAHAACVIWPCSSCGSVVSRRSAPDLTVGPTSRLGPQWSDGARAPQLAGVSGLRRADRGLRAALARRSADRGGADVLAAAETLRAGHGSALARHVCRGGWDPWRMSAAAPSCDTTGWCPASEGPQIVRCNSSFLTTTVSEASVRAHRSRRGTRSN